MQKFALKMLLTSRLLGRGSRRDDGAQFVAALLTMLLILFVGIYAWTRS